LKGCITQLFMGNPSQSNGVSPAIWDHTVLSAMYRHHLNKGRHYFWPTHKKILPLPPWPGHCLPLLLQHQIPSAALE